MPELPEVEITRCGLEPFVVGQKVQQIIIRHPQLRWPISSELVPELTGQTLNALKRRGKYLLFATDLGTLIIHLGMSGCLRILPAEQSPKKHDHVDIVFSNASCLRFTDPRRFGAMLWTKHDPMQHPLLTKLGVEPLERVFNGKYLFSWSRNKSVAIKQFIMQANIVVGVGNIYANESLFAAGIHPQRPAKQLTLKECETLAKNIKTILRFAIKQGGTTLRDFCNSEGKPGYFRQHLQVYGRGGQACAHCKTLLQEIRLGQRTTVYCSNCQKLVQNDKLY